MTNSAVQARALQVRRGGNEVLRGLDFDLTAGRITGLLGPSGCGKSTLMRAIVGLQAVTSGHLEVLGRPAGAADLRSRIGYAPQGMSVYRDLTVRENVRYFASCFDAPSDDIDRVLAQVDLSRYAARLVGAMSGGQQSRVSLAVALLGTPDLLVLDEPTVGLDPLLREQLWRLFAEITRSGVAVLVSSHVMDEAERCEDLLLVREGSLLAQDSPGSLKERTGTDSMDAAFLSLVGDAEEAA